MSFGVSGSNEDLSSAIAGVSEKNLRMIWAASTVFYLVGRVAS